MLNKYGKTAFWLSIGASILTLGYLDKEQSYQSPKQFQKTLDAVKLPSKSEETYYALILNGDTSKVHERNVERAASTLAGKITDASNLCILSNGTHHPKDIPTHLLTKASPKTYDMAMQYFQKRVDENDTFLLYTTGHGAYTGSSTVLLDEEEVCANNIANDLKKINTPNRISIMDQCYSGGFVNTFKDQQLPIIAISDTDEHNETYCEFYAKAFWSGLGDPALDSNNDGYVSFAEAHQEALKRHKEHHVTKPEWTNGQYYCAPQNKDRGLE